MTQPDPQQRRMEREIAIFAAYDDVHRHERAFHWRNARMLDAPMRDAFGRADVYGIYAEAIAAAIARTGLGTVFSLGCGDGGQEIATLRAADALGLPPFRIIGLDLAPAVAARANDAARAAGFGERLVAHAADLNEGLPGAEPVAAVMVHHALHHFTALEPILDSVAARLHPEGALVTFDMIGRNGHMRWPEVRALLRLLWPLLPEAKRRDHVLGRVSVGFQDWDCAIEGFEGVRAEEILGVIAERFVPERFAAWGAFTEIFVGRRFGPNFDPDVAEDRDFLEGLILLETRALAARRTTPTEMGGVFRQRAGGFAPDAATAERFARARRGKGERFAALDLDGFVPPYAAATAGAPPVLPAGCALVPAAAALAGGWEPPEADGVWAILDEQWLRLAFEEPVSAVSLSVWNPLPAARGQAITAETMGASAATGRLAEGEARTLRLAVAQPRRHWEIRLAAAAYRLPDLDGGPDKRPLAYRLASLQADAPAGAARGPCAVCGGSAFRDQAVIWDSLAEGWGLTPAEREMIDRQQGTCCMGCGANLRSAALARAILDAVGARGTLSEFVRWPRAAALRVLEVNEAGTLTPWLARLPGHRLVRYPEVDLQALPDRPSSCDLVVHSDTLEHVPEPRRALAECLRVLAEGGALCFTIPILPGRLTRSLAQGPVLHHGHAESTGDALRVQTDFGADAWRMVLDAGFARVDMTVLGEGLALTAWKGRARPGLLVAAERAREAEARLTLMEASSSWRLTAPLRAAVRRLRGTPALTVPALRAAARRLRGRVSVLPPPPEFFAQLRSLAEWREWVAGEPGAVAPGMGMRIAAAALAGGVVVPMFGEVPAAGVRLAGDEPREALLALGLNARLRAVLQLLATHERAHDVWGTRIYAHEALTPFALAMRGRYARFLGSEYAPDAAAAAALWPVPAVDIGQSGFPDGAFDFVLSNEVLEHVPDLDAALADTARILAPRGQLIATFPFDWNSATTSARARLRADSTVEHLAVPEYHGNPVDPEGGSLVFQIPGWDVLEACRAAGFADAWITFIGSARTGVCSRDIAGVFVLTAQR